MHNSDEIKGLTGESQNRMQPMGTTPASAHRNIETVARLEEKFLEQRNLRERIGDAVAGFMGTMTFALIQLVLFAVWAVLNSGTVPGIRPWDPYPYILLALLVSLEGVLLATFVLMKQNRMSRRADQRSHLDLQINLLAEKEITKILQLQRLMCERLGLPEASLDREVEELSEQTAVENLARELEKKLPE
jgi:uncharacterized membrane protein